MPGQPAARVGDNIMCPMVNPPLAPPKPPTFPLHTLPVGNPIDSAGAPTVEIGGAKAARIGDMSKCDTAEVRKVVPNAILRGSIPVRICGKPAARMTDSAAHPGSMILPPCCPTVWIGLAGFGGNPWAGTDECEKAKAGRARPGQDGQSYENCGVESSRQVVNRATGNKSSEDELDTAMKNGWADRVTDAAGNTVRRMSGATSELGRIGILGHYGVAASRVPSSMSNIARSVAAGRGVLADVYVGKLWPHKTLKAMGIAPGTAKGPHAIFVTGVEYDDDGNVVNVIINDTGRGTCGESVPAHKFEQALMGIAAKGRFEDNMIVTKNPIW